MRDLRRHASHAHALGDAEEQILLERSAQGDRSSQDQVVAAHLSMVIRLARDRADRGLSQPDLVQEGSIGLVEAVRRFATSGESSFAHFAEHMVGEQMDAALEAEASAVRDAELLVAAANDYERTEMLLRRELQRDATEHEIAQKLEWTVDRTRYVAQVVADARRRYDEEMLAFIDPDAVDIDDVIDG